MPQSGIFISFFYFFINNKHKYYIDPRLNYTIQCEDCTMPELVDSDLD